MIFEFLPVGPFQMNAYLVGCEKTRDAALIDAGDQVEDLLKMARKNQVNITKILQTHGHVDHVGAISDLKARTGATVYLHRKELPVYEASPSHAMMFGISGLKVPNPDHYIEEGQEIKVGELVARVVETPGHTPGGVVYYFEKEGVVFVGDTLFAGSVGRTDLPGGHYPTLMKSLIRLVLMPDQTVVYSGHGPKTTLGAEKRTNPFLLEL